MNGPVGKLLLAVKKIRQCIDIMFDDSEECHKSLSSKGFFKLLHPEVLANYVVSIANVAGMVEAR